MGMIQISISEQIRNVAQGLRLGVVECEVLNPLTSDELWHNIEEECARITATYRMEEINKRPEILATRQVYKVLGKDPNRYRPSAESLCRRAVKGLSLYRLSTLVDAINLISMRSGYSIGGFDRGKIQGDVLELGVGRADDVFEGIGRGLLNIEGLPVYRDLQGGIGTPTSDNERTKLTEGTTRLLMIINAYSGDGGLEETLRFSEGLLRKYASANRVERAVLGV